LEGQTPKKEKKRNKDKWNEEEEGRGGLEEEAKKR
jgi:hypothetical protein